MVDHDKLRDRFVLSEQSPSGTWIYEFNVGRKAESEGRILAGATKQIDAICFTSLPEQLPLSLQYEETPVEFTKSPETQNWSSVEDWESQRYKDEEAEIVEVKSGRPSMEGIGQLVVFRELVQQEWEVHVTGSHLVVDGADYLLEKVCERLDIKVTNYGSDISE